MAVVAIRCPASGQEISTNIEMDADSFALTPDAESRAYCPICKTEHVWRKGDARLTSRLNGVRHMNGKSQN